MIEPRVSYKYVTGVNNFINTLRFDQVDMLANTNEVEIGLTNRIYAKTGDTVREVFTWELFQKRFLDPTSAAHWFREAVMSRSPASISPASVFLTARGTIRQLSPFCARRPNRASASAGKATTIRLLRRFTNSMFSADVRYKRYFVSMGSTQVKPDPVVSGPANQFSTQAGYGDPTARAGTRHSRRFTISGSAFRSSPSRR